MSKAKKYKKLSELTELESGHLAWRLDGPTGLLTAIAITKGKYGDIDLVEAFELVGMSNHQAKINATKVMGYMPKRKGVIMNLVFDVFEKKMNYGEDFWIVKELAYDFNISIQSQVKLYEWISDIDKGKMKDVGTEKQEEAIAFIFDIMLSLDFEVVQAVGNRLGMSIETGDLCTTTIDDIRRCVRGEFD